VDAILNFFNIPPPNDLTNLTVRAADGSQNLTNSPSPACKGPATAADAWKNHKRMMIAAVKQRAIHKQQTQSARIAMLSGSLNCGGGGGGGGGGWSSINSGGSGVTQVTSGGEGGRGYEKNAEPSPAAMAQDFRHVPRPVVALGTSERQRRWLDIAPDSHPPPHPPLPPHPKEPLLMSSMPTEEDPSPQSLVIE